MSLGRDDFFGWGGRELAASGPASIVIALMEPLAGPPTEGIELRGTVEFGGWTAQTDGAEPQRINSPKNVKGPSVWRLHPAKVRDCPRELTLKLCCTSRGGRLVLDAWRTVREP